MTDRASLQEAADDFIDREDGGNLLRRLLYAKLELTTEVLSNVEVSILLDEAADEIRARADDLELNSKTDSTRDFGDYQRKSGAV